jgi:hypothetical protein
MVDYVKQLENLATGFINKFLANASAVPSPICQFRGTVLEYGAVIHCFKVIFEQHYPLICKYRK